jgi:hypothetical protein
MHEDLGSDDLYRCLRCNDRDAFLGDVCQGCKEELTAYWDNEKHWRDAWELEKDESLLERAKADINYVYRQLDTFEHLAREYADDPDFSAAIAVDKATFEARWARIASRLPARLEAGTGAGTH